MNVYQFRQAVQLHSGNTVQKQAPPIFLWHTHNRALTEKEVIFLPQLWIVSYLDQEGIGEIPVAVTKLALGFQLLWVIG